MLSLLFGSCLFFLKQLLEKDFDLVCNLFKSAILFGAMHL